MHFYRDYWTTACHNHNGRMHTLKQNYTRSALASQQLLPPAREVGREARKVELVLHRLSVLLVRDAESESNLCTWRRNDAQLLRFGRPGLDVLVRHGLHLQLLGLRVSLDALVQLTFGTATWKLTLSTGDADVKRARIWTTPGCAETLGVSVILSPFFSYAV